MPDNDTVWLAEGNVDGAPKDSDCCGCCCGNDAEIVEPALLPAERMEGWCVEVVVAPETELLLLDSDGPDTGAIAFAELLGVILAALFALGVLDPPIRLVAPRWIFVTILITVWSFKRSATLPFACSKS